MRKFLLLLLMIGSTFAQTNIRIMTYNLLNYTSNDVYNRNGHFKSIIENADPDIFAVQEMTSTFAFDSFVQNVLPTDYTAGEYIDNPASFTTDNAIFYKSSKIEFVDNTPIKTSLRDINNFRVRIKETGDTLNIFSVHLKASQGTENEERRAEEITELREYTLNFDGDDFYLVLGDFNLYRATEEAFQILLDQTNSGYFLDPVNQLGSWHENADYVNVHSQSTRLDALSDGAGGGLDDRFDMILVSPAIMESNAINYSDNSYTVFGNDGAHFNVSINEGGNSAVSQELADALHLASDHLPVYLDLTINVTSVEEELGTDYRLFQNYPNPFNPNTEISYQLAASSFVNLKVYDLLGNEIANLVNGEQSPGNYKVDFNATELSSGVYFYKLEADKFVQVKKMVLLK